MFKWFMAISLATTPTLAITQEAICGDPPPVANEALKGEIAGKAEILSRFFGNTSLTGKIETARTEIFSKYPNINERSNAYFEYLTCILLMQSDLSSKEKLDSLVEIRRTFSKPVSSTTTGHKNQPNTIQQTTSGHSSPAVSNINGNVDINIKNNASD